MSSRRSQPAAAPRSFALTTTNTPGAPAPAAVMPAATSKRGASPRPARPALVVSLAAGALALSGCGWASDIAEGLDSSNQKEHSVETGAEGKESQLLAGWVPDTASEVRVMQQTNGSERLLTFEFAGDMPAECIAIAAAGQPTQEELAAAYATDQRTADFPVEDWTTHRSLEAEWWPEGTLEETTHLCGRWWVSERGGTYFGFAAAQIF